MEAALQLLRAGLKAGLQLRRAGFGDHHLLKDEAGICFRHGLALPSMRLRNHNSWMRVRTLVGDCHGDRPHPCFKHFFDLSSLRQAARSASSIAYAYMSIVKVVVGFSACDGVDIYVQYQASYSQRNRNNRVTALSSNLPCWRAEDNAAIHQIEDGQNHDAQKWQVETLTIGWRLK